tara:strand:+ start:2796 stop:3893 length:1098 start_codon:yes stop_codon:yes gene_type:complete
MNITLKRTEEQVELVKAMASRNRDVAYEAQQALAEFIGPVLAEVVDNAPTLSNLFTAFQFSADDNPSIPLDLYHDVTDEDYIKVYSTNAPGGLPSSHVTPTHSELKLATYRLESAVDFDKRYASRSRLDVVSKSLTRLAQEVLLQQENSSAALLFGTISDNTSKLLMSSTTAGQFKLDDFNRMLTKMKRNNPSWSGGTPENSRGMTDIMVSPEIIQSLREMSYNPIETTSLNVATDPAGAPLGASITAPDNIRNSLFNQAGLPQFYGISIMESYELGSGQKYTQVANRLGLVDAAGGTRDDIAIGLDRSRESMLRAVAVDAESGTTLTVAADDQYVGRAKKIGYYAELEEGRTVINDGAILAIKV